MVFGYATYEHKNVSQRSTKFYIRAEKEVYSGNRDYMHRIYIPTRKQLVATKHGAFNECAFLLHKCQTVSVYIEEGLMDDRLADIVPEMAHQNSQKAVPEMCISEADVSRETAGPSNDNDTGVKYA